MPTSQSNASLRILLVEDHTDTAEMLAKLLIDRRHDVQIAATLADARRACGEARFDLILCDIGLPDGSGLELAPLVQQLQPKARLIALTAYGMASDVEAARSAGFHAHILKPVIMDALLSELASSAAHLVDEQPRAERLNVLRERCRKMSTPKLLALAAVLKRRTDDVHEELQVIAEQLTQRHPKDTRARPA